MPLSYSVEAMGFNFIYCTVTQTRKGVKRTSIQQMWWPLLSFCLEEALLHLHDALRKIAWNFSETFTAAIHNVVVAGAAGWTHCNLRDTRPWLRQWWTCRKQHNVCDCLRWSLGCYQHFYWTDMKEVERRNQNERGRFAFDTRREGGL